jgi:hypothetical protein
MGFLDHLQQGIHDPHLSQHIHGSNHDRSALVPDRWGRQQSYSFPYGLRVQTIPRIPKRPQHIAPIARSLSYTTLCCGAVKKQTGN